jgi:hypothetical protein
MFQGGSMFRCALADPVNDWAQIGGWRDVGSINVVVPDMQRTKITAKDARNGNLIEVESRTIETTEKFTISTLNCSLENKIFIWGASAVALYSQSASPVTDREHLAWPDSIVPLLDAGGLNMYDIASVQSVLVGATSKAQGTDWIADPYMLKRGYIYIPPGSTITAGATIKVSFTPNVIASSKRQFNPHTASKISVLGQVLWTDGADTVNPEIVARDSFRATIDGQSPAFSETDYSRINFDVTVVQKLNDSVQPAGRVLYPLGAVPTIALP